jgi:hypothetical protein
MLNTGIAAKARQLADRIKYDEIEYVPKKFTTPERLIKSTSLAWVGLEKIIEDIIHFSKIETKCALEFGVEFGYSTSALANYFNIVKGVDTFTGDLHAGFHGDIFALTQNNLQAFANIQLIKADYRDFISTENNRYHLIHVDIIHTYEDTYACGLWAAQHSDCTLFHDTQSFPDVKRAVADVARATKKKFYNYRKCNGLGILV